MHKLTSIGLCLLAAVALSGCTAGSTPPPGTGATGTGASGSSPWPDLCESNPDIQITYGNPGTVVVANDANETCKDINSYLAETVEYTQVLPSGTQPSLPDASEPPPVLTLTTDLHSVTITPAWYWKSSTGSDGTVQNVVGVLVVVLDGTTTNLQSQEFYDWLENGQWLRDFHSEG